MNVPGAGRFAVLAFPWLSLPNPGSFTHDEDSRLQARPCPFFGSCGGRDADAVGRNQRACGSAFADQSSLGAISETRFRRADDRSPRRSWRSWWRSWRRPRWWRISRRRPRRLPWRRCGLSWRRISFRSCLPRRLSPRWISVRTPASLSPAFLLCAGLLLSTAQLLPGGLDLLRTAQDLPLSPVASPSLAPPPPALSLLVSLEGIRVAEMNQAPVGRLNCVKKYCRPSIPILEFPGLELPRRQRLQPPLHPAVRRPGTETRPLLDLGLIDMLHVPAPRLVRRLADQIDEFSLVGHGSLLRKASPSPAQCAPNCLRTPFGNASTLRQGRVRAG